MTDKELADKVIALGVGYQGTYPLSCDGVGFYHEPYEDGGMCAELYVRDWRVAGALMEKCSGVNTVRRDGKWKSYAVKNFGVALTAGNDSMPRAIIEACVEALP